MKRIRTDSIQPSHSRCSPPGKNSSTMWRLFCLSRRTPWSNTRPVSTNDLLISVENPSMSTPVTNAAKIATAFWWKARTPGVKAS